MSFNFSATSPSAPGLGLNLSLTPVSSAGVSAVSASAGVSYAASKSTTFFGAVSGTPVVIQPAPSVTMPPPDTTASVGVQFKF